MTPPLNAKVSSSSRLIVYAPALILFSLYLIFCFNGPFERDQGIYMLVAEAMLRGDSLYSSVWDHKPPAIHIVYTLSALVFGPSRLALAAVTVTLSALTLFGVRILLKRIGVAERPTMVLLAIYAVLSVSPNLEAHQANTEAGINAMLVWCLVVFSNATPHGLFIILGSFLFGLATLFKPVALVAVIPFSIYVLLTSKPSSLRIFSAIALLVGPIVVWFMCVAWFMAHNRFSDFAASVHSYNRFYAGDLVLNLLGWLNPRMLRASAFLWLYVPLGVALFLMIRAPVKAKILTLVGLVSIAVAIAAPGNFYIHYYQLALPWCVLALGVFTTIVKRLPTIFVLSLTVLSVVVGEGALWLLPDFHRHPFSRSSPQRSAQLFAPHLRDSLKPGEWFLDLTSSPGLYLDSGIVPRHGVFHLAPLVEGPERARLRQKLIDILNQQPPRFIVTSDANTLSLFDSEADIARFFSRYKPVLFQSPFTVYALSDREAE